MRRHNRLKKMSGYIKLHRAIEHHWLWLDPRRLQWWIQLLFMAAWEPKQVSFGNTNINLKRGQIATTTRMLMKKFMCCNQTVFNFLAVLENDNMIIRETNQKMTLITIVNYERYQQDSPQSSDADNTYQSSSAHRKPNRKVEQTKEDKKEEEKIIINFISPSRERDLEFLEELKSNEVFFEQCAMTLKTDIASIKGLLIQFSNEMLLQEKFHNSSADYRQHFFNWIKKTGGVAPKKNNLTNGSKDKYAARRGRNVPPPTQGEDDSTF